LLNSGAEAMPAGVLNLRIIDLVKFLYDSLKGI